MKLNFLVLLFLIQASGIAPSIAARYFTGLDDCDKHLRGLMGYGYNIGGHGPKKVESEEEKKARLERERKEKLEKERRKQLAIKNIKQIIAKRSAGAQEVLDGIELLKIEDQLTGIESPWSVSLLIGHSDQKLTDELIDRALYIANFIKDAGYYVLFDADATIAPYIARALGDQGLGISAGHTPIKDVPYYVVIKNPYVRLSAFKAGEKIVLNTDSIIGTALAVNGDLDYFIGPTKPKNELLKLSQWQPEKEKNLGLKFKDIEWLGLGEVKKRIPKFKSIDQILEEAKEFELADLVSRFKIMNNARASLAQEAKSGSAGYGAVIFGSGQYPKKYTQPLYKAVKALASLGIPITTGGAGGVMEIGNQAAFDAGVNSTGISLGGKLKTEKEDNTSIQTQNIPVGGYEERIPLLLENKKIVIIAPGGMGTMKELATALIQESPETEDRLIVFFGRDYYSPLFQSLKKLLPKSIFKNFHLVDNQAELVQVVEDYSNKVWSKNALKQIGSWVTPTPRNNNDEFIEKAIILPESIGLLGDDDDDYRGWLPL